MWKLLLVVLLLSFSVSKLLQPIRHAVSPAEPQSATYQQYPQVSFLALEPPDWRVLPKLLASHQLEQQHLLQQLSGSLECALQTEQDLQLPPTLSTAIQERIDTLAALLERDLEVLTTQILRPVPYRLALPSVTLDGDATPHRRTTDFATTTANHWTAHRTTSSDAKTLLDATASYDSVRQVTAHLVRDWSDHGRAIRESLYDWCLEQLPRHVHPTAPLSVLVPGAGLGRLAYEIALRGHSVHAVEVSWAMAAAASWVFRSNDTLPNYDGAIREGQQRARAGEVSPGLVLHPYLMDALSNEVDAQLRYVPVSMTRADLSRLPTNASLSYTVAGFEKLPLGSLDTAGSSKYSVVVTCFFIDTATNIVEYILKIHQALTAGGTWINVGPIQWHRNAQIFPSSNELRMLMERMGFAVTLWSVDDTPVEYRDRGAAVRSTHYDAYCPIRFVARKTG